MNQHEINSAKLRMLQAIKQRSEQRAAQLAKQETSQQHHMAHIPLAVTPAKLPEHIITTPNPIATAIQLNEQQQLAIQYGVEGREFCLIGAAGTGKTTSVRELIKQLIQKYKQENNGVLPDGCIAIVAFTRRAVRNIAKAVSEVEGAKLFCQTAHSYLAYAPNRDGYMNKDGDWCSSMRFEPTFTALNPRKLTRLIIIDEASMLSYTGLYRELREASPNAKFIFIGDLNQLAPVFGDAVLGFKLGELPVVELTQVYRQAMDSPIIWFQHNYTLKGLIPTTKVLEDLTKAATPEKGCEFIPFKQNHMDGEVMCEAIANYMMRQLEAGLYDPVQDTILIPFNKSFGSIGINLHIAEYLAIKYKLKVFEIVSGYIKSYYAVGDFVMYDKKECIITDIQHNKKFYGVEPQLPSVDLSRYGYIRIGGKAPQIDMDHQYDFAATSAEALLSQTSAESQEEKTIAASHTITLRDCDTDMEYTLSTIGEIRALDFGYCMTIHKSQGSEWRKVWLILHRMHATMLSRELIYTGMTRAKDKLAILYSAPTAIGRSDSTIHKSIKKCDIPGLGWKSKTEYFKGKKLNAGYDISWDQASNHTINYNESDDWEY